MRRSAIRSEAGTRCLDMLKVSGSTWPTSSLVELDTSCFQDSSWARLVTVSDYITNVSSRTEDFLLFCLLEKKRNYF